MHCCFIQLLAGAASWIATAHQAAGQKACHICFPVQHTMLACGDAAAAPQLLVSALQEVHLEHTLKQIFDQHTLIMGPS